MFRYHRYLQSVVESTDEYQEISELLQRYETLQATHQDLLAQQEQMEEELQSVKEDLQLYTHEKSDRIVVLNNRLSQLKRECEMYDVEDVLQQTKRDARMTNTMQKTLEYGQLIMSTHNLFLRCCQNSVIAHGADLSPLEQLEVIGHFVSDLDATVRRHGRS